MRVRWNNDLKMGSWQRLGLEWLYRAIRQPSRFKRIAKLPGFLLSAVGARIQGK